MNFRFPIGTQYRSHGKPPRICTVEDQLTVTNSKGDVVSHYYTSSHEFAGQKIYDRQVCETTIARNIVKGN